MCTLSVPPCAVGAAQCPNRVGGKIHLAGEHQLEGRWASQQYSRLLRSESKQEALLYTFTHCVSLPRRWCFLTVSCIGTARCTRPARHINHAKRLHHSPHRLLGLHRHGNVCWRCIVMAAHHHDNPSRGCPSCTGVPARRMCLQPRAFAVKEGVLIAPMWC